MLYGLIAVEGEIYIKILAVMLDVLFPLARNVYRKENSKMISTTQMSAKQVVSINQYRHCRKLHVREYRYLTT